MVCGPSKPQMKYVANLSDIVPGKFEIISKGKKSPKDNDYYYVIKLSDGSVSIVSSGTLRGIHEGGTAVFDAAPTTDSEATLLPNLLIGVKDHQWIVAAA
jgi:hypothetical protein